MLRQIEKQIEELTGTSVPNAFFIYIFTWLPVFFLLGSLAIRSQIHPAQDTGSNLVLGLSSDGVQFLITGLTGALTVGTLPLRLNIQNPLIDCPLRVVCFFYGCKLLDLALRMKHPPNLLGQDGQPRPFNSFVDVLRYMWLLLSGTRYSSFDIAVKQKERRPEDVSLVWTFGPPVFIPALVFLVPTPETKSLLVMLIIELGLESLHTLLHPRCPNYLFWQPFAASSLTSFWRTHWHAGAETFLRSVGYRPWQKAMLGFGASKGVARAVGILAAFSLSGVWHGWATAALSTKPWMVAFRVWSLFLSMGIGVLLESIIPKAYRGSLFQRLAVWGVFMFYAGWAWRGLQSSCKVQWLAEI